MSFWIVSSRSLQVRLEPDRGDEARLVGAQQVPRPAHLEVVERDPVARAQVGVLLEHAQPLLRLGRHRVARRRQQVAVRAVVRASDAAAELVQVGEPEPVRARDDDRVGARHVEPGLDDRRRHQHVDLAVEERDHHALELLLGHLPVRDRDPHLRSQRLDQPAGAVDRLDPVVDVEHLPAAVDLAADRVLDQLLVELRHPRDDRRAVPRRGFDEAHLAESHEAHLERARDRRGGQGQHVDARAELPEALLVADAEALLLVDHDQAQVGERDVLRQEPVRPDHDVDPAVGDALDDGARLGGGC